MNKTEIVFIFIIILFITLAGYIILSSSSAEKINTQMPFALFALGGARHALKNTKRVPTHTRRMNQRAGDKLKNIKESPQSNFEVRVRDIFGQIVKNTIELARVKGKKVPDNISYKFYTMYPSWLRWRGKELEIDGYNVWLGLAFEVQGPQHTNFDKKMDKSYDDYYNRLCNDSAKRILAEEYGVGFITIDYKVPKHLLSDYIKSRIYDLCDSHRASQSNTNRDADRKTTIRNAPYTAKKLRCDLLEPISLFKPENYIAEFSYTPYRNFIYEKKNGLNMLDKNSQLKKL